MTRIRGIAPAVVTAIALALAACGGGETEEPAGADTTAQMEEAPVEVTGVTLGSAVGADKRVTERTSTFAPTDTIYAAVETEGAASDATLVARWTYEDGQTVDETSRSIAPDGPAVTEFHVSKPDGWPTGGYEVVILLDGEEAERASFTVE